MGLFYKEDLITKEYLESKGFKLIIGKHGVSYKLKIVVDYGYGYSNKGVLKPNGEVPNKLIQFKNEDGTYTYSENYPITIKILEQSRYVSNGELEVFYP